jgi:hypothetical protein
MVDFHTIPTFDVGSVSTRKLRHDKEGSSELSIGVEAWNARRYPGPRMAATKLCMYSLPSVWLEQVWRLAVLMIGTACNMSTLDRRERAAGVVSRPLTVVGLKSWKIPVSLGSTGLSFSSSATGSEHNRWPGPRWEWLVPCCRRNRWRGSTGKGVGQVSIGRPSITQVWLAEADSERHSHDSEGWR